MAGYGFSPQKYIIFRIIGGSGLLSGQWSVNRVKNRRFGLCRKVITILGKHC